MDFFALSDDVKQSYILLTAEEKNDSESNIEKDLWVTKVLSILFKSPLKDSMAFKGGTSLSKGWGIIHRFSEDVDLVIDPQLINSELPVLLTRKELKQFRKDTEAYVANTIKPLLEKELKLLNVTVETVPSEIPDPTILKIVYSPLFELDRYNKGYVQLEISSRATMEPHTQRDIRSDVCAVIVPIDETLDDDLSLVNIVLPHKTCLEKIFLLHEEFSKAVPRSERMSRHLYDLYKLKEYGAIEEVLSEPALYCSLIKHRFLFNRITDVDYVSMFPQNINIIPPEHIIDDWKKDYEQMKIHMINEEIEIAWDTILSTAKEINDRIHAMNLTPESFLKNTNIEYLSAWYSDVVRNVKNHSFKEAAKLLDGRELTSGEKKCINEILVTPDDRKNFEIMTKQSLGESQ